MDVTLKYLDALNKKIGKIVYMNYNGKRYITGFRLKDHAHALRLFKIMQDHARNERKYSKERFDYKENVLIYK